MRKSRFTESRSSAFRRPRRLDRRSLISARKHGISERTYYRRRAKYGGMEVGDAKKLRSIEDENLASRCSRPI